MQIKDEMRRERLRVVNTKNMAYTLFQYNFNVISPPKYFLCQMRTTSYVNMFFSHSMTVKIKSFEKL